MQSSLRPRGLAATRPRHRLGSTPSRRLVDTLHAGTPYVAENSVWFWLTIIVLCVIVGFGVQMFAGHIVGLIFKKLDGPL